MRVGDRVIALTDLWINADVLAKKKDLKGEVGIVLERPQKDGFFDIAFPIGIAIGCERGRHVELEVWITSPLAKALE